MGVFLIYAVSLSFIPVNYAEAGLANHLVINEVSIDSIVGTGGSDDDWVELYNPTDQTISLVGLSLQKATVGGGITTSAKVVLNGSIAAKGYFLVVKDSASTTQSLMDMADLLSEPLLLAINNTVFLVNSINDIATSTDLGVIDFVGWGTAVIHEGASSTPQITEGKSIARVPDGEDTDQNFNDFKLQNSPTPTNAKSSSGDNQIGGTVLLTITPDAVPVQNITPTAAQIVFQVNSAGTALINYGLTNSYGSSTPAEAVSANLTKTINLNGLVCATIYHYSIYAANTGATEYDTTADAVFTTLPCGIKLDSLTMTKAAAKANNQYTDGWQWEFNLTIWNINETSLKMKFDQWNGAGVLAAADNMQFSADTDNGTTWHDITANSAYPDTGADLSGIDNNLIDAGRQVKILVRMKVPVGTMAGYYNSNYGILTE